MDAETRQRLRLLKARALHWLRRSNHGELASHRRGEGLEIFEVRPYDLGDDVRRMDWLATARLGQPLVKTFSAEQEQRLWIVLDSSPRMAFGSTGQTKHEAGRDCALILSFLAEQADIRAGLYLNASAQELLIQNRGRKHYARLQARLAMIKIGASRFDWSACAERLLSRKSRGTIVLFSDFSRLARPDWVALRRLSQVYQLVLVQILDPLEVSWPAVGLVRLKDSETGRTVVIDTDDSAAREAFAKQRLQELQQLQRFCMDHKIQYTLLKLSKQVSSDWIRYLSQKSLILRRRRG